MDKIVVDCLTRQERRVRFTEDEIAQRLIDIETARLRDEAAAVEESERRSDHTTANAAIINLQSYIDSSSPTNAQTVAVVKLLCRIAIILIKRTLGAV